MKLLLIICLGLLAFISVPALCLPERHSSLKYPYFYRERNVLPGHTAEEFGRGQFGRVTQRQNSLRAEAARTASDLAKTQARVLAQGSGVALLLPGHNYHLWVGCTCTVCKLEHCPGHSFADVDQFECPENSFQLYRALGPGNIRTGDFVGLYYPNGGTWLAMINGVGQQSKCPGAPTDQDGFSSYSKWNECSDSAFRIYAKGKSSDQTIESGNLISLYYPKNVGKGYVEYLTAGLTTSTCMKDESASLLPPTSAAYDLCQSSTAFLTIYAIEESLYGLN
jgi:hypothetical protein